MNSDQVQQATPSNYRTETHRNKRDWLLGILLVAAVFLAYQPVWRGVQIWDDWRHITSPELATFRGLARIWFVPGTTTRFDPLVDTVFWIERHLWGASTLGYHLVSIACHAITALLMVVVLRRLQIKGAWLAAALFAVHPVHVESVAWISELKNTMSGVFFLTTTLLYLKFDEARTRAGFALALGSFLCALLSKTTAVVWPVGMLVILWWKRGGLSWKRDVLPLIPFVALALLDGWVAMRVERNALGPSGWQLKFSMVQRLVIAGHAAWFYLAKLIWPGNLCPIYPRWPIDPLARIDYLYPIGGAALLAACWILRNRSRAPLAAAAFFIGSLLPLLGIFSFSYQRFSFVADHFQYLASLSIITMVASGLVWFQEGRPILPRVAVNCLGFAVVAVLAALTWQHSHAFADMGTFARTILAMYPDNWAAHDDLGVVFASEKNWAEAVDEFHRALRGNPNYILAHFDLGSVLQAQGRLDEAAHEYEEVLRRDPNVAAVRYNLGCLLASQGKFGDAVEQYQYALRLQPNASEVHNNLGTALASLGRFVEAITEFRQAIELRPDYEEAHLNLGHALEHLNQFTEAVQEYERAVQLDPKNTTNHYNLAIAMANSGNLAPAVEELREAARMDANLPDVHAALAKVLDRQGLHDEAQREMAEQQRRKEFAPREGPTASPESTP